MYSNSSTSFHPNLTTNAKITSTPKIRLKKSKTKRDSTGLTESEKIVLERNAITDELTVNKKKKLEMEYMLTERNAKMALIAKQSVQYDRFFF